MEGGRCQGEKHGIEQEKDKVSTQDETGLENTGFGKLLVKGINNETVASIDASGAAERAYLLLGCLIGAAGGPLQAASRTLLIQLAPKDRIAQYFGLFALTGKVTSFIGPLLIGAITAATASQKAGMATLVVFFVAGLALLIRVRETTVVPAKAGTHTA